MKEIMKRNKANFKAEIQKVLLGNIIMTRYNNKTYKVDDIAFNRNPKETFNVSYFFFTSIYFKLRFIMHYAPETFKMWS